MANTPPKNFIFQMDGMNHDESPYTEGRALGANLFLLFDVSGGVGRVPDVWTSPFPNLFCGYAGGLGPEALARKVRRISEVAGERTIWIDMETRVRSEDNSKFDLSKVVKCLEIAQAYIE